MIKKLLVLVCFLSTIPVSAKPLPVELAKKIDNRLIENHQRYGVVSQSVLLFKNGELIYDGMHGKANIELSVPIRRDVVYPVYSISKLFASVALMKLVENGQVDVNRSIRHYLPDLPKHWQQVTVQHCLSHTSGLPEYFSMELTKSGFLPSKKAVFKALTDAPFQFETGSANTYNHTNFLVLAAIAEKQTNKPFMQLVKETIIEPLRLKDSQYSPASEVIPNVVSSYWGKSDGYVVDKGINWVDYTYSHSGLYSSTKDIANFINGLLKGKVLKASTVQKMWQPVKRNDGSVSAFSLGWEYEHNNGVTSVGHVGGDRVLMKHFFKPNNNKETYTLVYFTNGYRKNTWISVLYDSILSLIDSDMFELSVVSQSFFDKVLGGATSATELDQIFAELSTNAAVKDYGVERFIMMKGWAMRHTKGAGSAIPLFELYTRQFPDSARSWAYLGDMWLIKGVKSKAIKFFKKALSVDPEFAYAKSQLDTLVP